MKPVLVVISRARFALWVDTVAIGTEAFAVVVFEGGDVGLAAFGTVRVERTNDEYPVGVGAWSRVAAESR